MIRIQCRLKSAMKRAGLWIVSNILTIRGRRIIFMTTAVCALNHWTKVTNEQLEHLNSVLHLAKDYKALEGPASLKSLVWGDTVLDNDLVQICRSTDICTPATTEALEKAVDSVPSWVTYGRKDDMVKDLLLAMRSSGDNYLS